MTKQLCIQFIDFFSRFAKMLLPVTAGLKYLVEDIGTNYYKINVKLGLFQKNKI